MLLSPLIGVFSTKVKYTFYIWNIKMAVSFATWAHRSHDPFLWILWPLKFLGFFWVQSVQHSFPMFYTWPNIRNFYFNFDYFLIEYKKDPFYALVILSVKTRRYRTHGWKFYHEERKVPNWEIFTPPIWSAYGWIENAFLIHIFDSQYKNMKN